MRRVASQFLPTGRHMKPVKLRARRKRYITKIRNRYKNRVLEISKCYSKRIAGGVSGCIKDHSSLPLINDFVKKLILCILDIGRWQAVKN